MFKNSKKTEQNTQQFGNFVTLQVDKIIQRYLRKQFGSDLVTHLSGEPETITMESHSRPSRSKHIRSVWEFKQFKQFEQFNHRYQHF